MATDRRRPSLFGPILLIGLGILFLLTNLNVIDADFWGVIWQMWPVLLIVAGLDMLLGRRAAWLGALAAILLLMAIVAAAWLVPVSVSRSDVPGDAELIQQPAEGLERAAVTISTGVSDLSIEAAAESSPYLIDGWVTPLRGEEILSEFGVEEDTATYVLESRSRNGIFAFPFLGGRFREERGAGNWDLQLNRDVPLDLTVNTGVGNAELNLAELYVTQLDVDTGVGATDVTLPALGEYAADINGGVGEIVVRIPPGLAVRLAADAGLGAVDVRGEYTQRDDVYESPEYDSAENRVNLNVDGGIGSITVQQVERR